MAGEWMMGLAIELVLGLTGGIATVARGAPPAPDRRDAAMLAELDEVFGPKVEKVVAALRAKGWKARIGEGKRTIAQQKKKVDDKVSQTMRSLHLCGKAVDIIDSRYAWDIGTDHAFWTDLGEAARAEGLSWGGDWEKFKDVAHVELAASECNWAELGL